MLNRRGKVWGNTAKLFNNNNVEIHRIEGCKGGYSSKHYHNHKHNMFFVESGRLEVIIFRKDAHKDIEDRTVLESGDSTFVEPGLYHQFRVLEDCVAYEIYWTSLEEDDIIRENVGGINNG